MPKHALLYIRKSIVRTGSDTISPERQREACLAEAAHHGWLVDPADIFIDAEGHMSGRDDQRPAWLAMQRRLARDPNVAAVIVESLARASRSVRSFFVFVDEMRRRQIALVSLKERFDTTNAMGQAMLGFIAVVNQLESDLASERMTGQIAFKRSHGRHWGRTPFGCDRESVTGALVPSVHTYRLNGHDQLYHDSLARCYDLYRTGDYSLDALATTLNADGWRFRGVDGEPRRWDRNNTRSVLMMHRVYAGWVPVEGHVKDKPAEWVRANYAPVLPVALCEAVEATLLHRGQTQRHPAPPARQPSPASDYPLTGVLYCAECGKALKGCRYRYGTLRRMYRHQVLGECHQTWSRADALEEQALAMLGRLAMPAHLGEGVVETLLDAYGRDAHDEIAADLEGAAQSLSRAEAEVQRLVELAITTPIDQAVYQRMLAQRTDELAILRDRHREIQLGLEREELDLSNVVERLNAIACAFQTTEATMRRQLVRGVFERLEASTDELVAWVPRDWCRPFF